LARGPIGRESGPADAAAAAPTGASSPALPMTDIAPVRHAWWFLLLVVAASWLLWSVLAIAGPALPHAAATGLLMAGFLAVGVLAVAMAEPARAGIRSRVSWRARFDVRRIGAVGWISALLLFPVLATVAAWLDAWQTGVSPAGGAVLHSGSLPAWLRWYGFSLLAGPLLEELGWRGVALAPLERRYGALRGAALLGCVHALWHVPLFIVPGGYFHELGLLTPAFWRFMADILVFDLLAAALFNATRSSVLAAVVLHASFNAAGLLWVLSPQASWVREGLAVAVAALLIFATRGRLFLGIRTDARTASAIAG